MSKKIKIFITLGASVSAFHGTTYAQSSATAVRVTPVVSDKVIHADVPLPQSSTRQVRGTIRQILPPLSNNVDPTPAVTQKIGALNSEINSIRPKKTLMPPTRSLSALSTGQKSVAIQTSKPHKITTKTKNVQHKFVQQSPKPRQSVVHKSWNDAGKNIFIKSIGYRKNSGETVATYIPLNQKPSKLTPVVCQTIKDSPIKKNKVVDGQRMASSYADLRSQRTKPTVKYSEKLTKTEIHPTPKKPVDSHKQVPIASVKQKTLSTIIKNKDDELDGSLNTIQVLPYRPTDRGARQLTNTHNSTTSSSVRVSIPALGLPEGITISKIDSQNGAFLPILPGINVTTTKNPSKSVPVDGQSPSLVVPINSSTLPN